MPPLDPEIYIPAFAALVTALGVLWSRNITLTDGLISSTQALSTIAQRLTEIELRQDR